ncbi:MAG: hypothetical protein JW956_08555 [Calditrichaceae bacterium]|nr:hypothetical protein [Calditrichaceae bacterium]
MISKAQNYLNWASNSSDEHIAGHHLLTLAMNDASNNPVCKIHMEYLISGDNKRRRYMKKLIDVYY